MRSVTHCPACQTQFFVTEEQLNQHQGQVRCGNCLHVFDAKEQFVEDTSSEITIDLIEATSDATATSEANATLETSKFNTELAITSLDAIKSIDKTPSDQVTIITSGVISEDKPYNFENEVTTPKPKVRHVARSLKSLVNPVFTIILLLAAILQSLYYLRNNIATFYPTIKPYLVQACLPLNCSIDLPKQIEFIVIDDSDMEEDTTHADLMHLTSTLVNQAAFNQAYPNVEITLTDTDDKPKLRRIFKPSEYLPEHTDISKGIAMGEEIKIKLAITTSGVTVAGYRVFVTY